MCLFLEIYKVRISKKNKRRIFDSLDSSLNEILSEYFDKDEIEHPPDTWFEETREKFDLLNEYRNAIQVKLEEVINDR